MTDNLRTADLIAKTARVTLKDTLRVIKAMDAVSQYRGVFLQELLEEVDFEVSRPSPENVAACEDAAFELKRQAQSDTIISAALCRIRELQ